MEDVIAKRGLPTEVGIHDDPVLWDLLKEQSQHNGRKGLSGFSPKEVEELEDWDPPFDLRVNRPRAINLRKFWALTNNPIPPEIEASLGPNIPVLISHVITPFASGGMRPRKVWGLGYEFEVTESDINTISVLPNDEVLKIGEIDHNVELGLQIGGGVGIPQEALQIIQNTPSISLTGAQLQASSNTQFQISLHLAITLRKIVGAPVGVGGAMWKLYRRDERLDKPHTLLQTIVVGEDVKKLNCKIKTWAKQAGWLGGNWGAKMWPYKDQEFEISLEGL
jgi:hypothetical protein